MTSSTGAPPQLSHFFDLRSGLGGAIIMSGLVWWVNAQHGALPASVAAAKQAAYTFLFGGLIMRFCQSLARRDGPSALWLAAACLVPSLVTIALVFAVHSLRGTPEPLLSTVPAAVLAPPSFAVYAWRSRRPAIGPLPVQQPPLGGGGGRSTG